MRVLGHRRRATEPPPGVDVLSCADRGESLDGLLGESDFVVLAVPLSDATRTLITPHVTPQVPDRTARSLEVIEENARRYRAGEPLLNLLTAEDVYTRG
jgi:phosphoglycerate dehydrogenase-like enzyme